MESSEAIPGLEARLTQYIQRYVAQNGKSAKVNHDARDALPGGTTRAVLSHQPFPIAFKGGRGPFVTSLDDDEYIDFVSEYCAAMLGHSHPEIVAAVHRIADGGFALGGPNPSEGELARLIVTRFPSLQAVRFCNSGTEANTLAIATALAYTHRKQVLAFENGYHGGTLSFSGESPLTLPHEFVLGKFNDIQKTRSVISPKIGAIIVEPMLGAGGMQPAEPAFLSYLRQEATSIGAVLIFDEVVTSRLYFSGMQGLHGIIPDMTTLGKHFGGGFSFGAFGGNQSIMDLFNPGSPRMIYHSGTWNNNVFSMGAGVVATRLMTHEAIEGANRLGDQLRDGISAIFSHTECINPTGYGSVVGMHFSGSCASQLRDLFYFFLLQERIYIGHRGFFALNLSHTEDHILRVLKIVDKFNKEIQVISEL